LPQCDGLHGRVLSACRCQGLWLAGTPIPVMAVVVMVVLFG
jgi:hypothetical protein